MDMFFTLTLVCIVVSLSLFYISNIINYCKSRYCYNNVQSYCISLFLDIKQSSDTTVILFILRIFCGNISFHLLLILLFWPCFNRGLSAFSVWAHFYSQKWICSPGIRQWHVNTSSVSLSNDYSFNTIHQ